MLEGSNNNIERRPNNQDYYNLTPFEGLLIGGSDSISVKNKEMFVDICSLPDLMRDPDIRKVILSPKNVTNGKLSLKEVIKAREDVSFMSLTPIVFELKGWADKYMTRNIRLAFKSCKWDNAGLLSEFEIYPVDGKTNQRLQLSEIDPKDRVLAEEFKHVIESLGEENNVFKFRTKSAEEIKAGANLKKIKSAVETTKPPFSV